MDALPLRWTFATAAPYPQDWLTAIQRSLPPSVEPISPRLGQLLWQRQLGQPDQIPGLLDPGLYQPTPASAFGVAMERAVDRLQQALAQQETVTIWGDFDADGVTATAVLWDGLGQLFPKQERLHYYIPNRLYESHGLSRQGLDQVKAWGTGLIITCDTGSTNGAEIAYANELGMAVIVTDHHTLPGEEPPGVALINPRCLPADHPLATLSGVAVAYKLLEGLYAALDQPPPLGLEHLLDLVAIGLIADLVELKGDCRYLAQRGLRRLQTHTQPYPPYARPGVAELLRLCKKTGDRPTDVSFGLGPRINAVSRIHGDASFCVELLTSQDGQRCQALAYEAELANTRRKALQKDIYAQAMQRVAQIDLATTQCLVLADEQWPAGVLGLVAGQLSQALGRPTVLLRIDPLPPDAAADAPHLARGSARSVPGLDLYELFQAQADLLTGFGGHPLAAGLTLPVANIPMLTAALNRSVREQRGSTGAPQPTLTIDLVVTVDELGQTLFQALKRLEPYGMGNPVPKLLIRNGWVQNASHKKLRDSRGQTVGFIRTRFELRDDTSSLGFPGEWWGHYQEELPQGRCDLVVELDHNGYSGYHVKLVDVRPVATGSPDFELTDPSPATLSATDLNPIAFGLGDLGLGNLGLGGGRPSEDSPIAPLDLWQQLVGMAKYLARTETPVLRSQLLDRLSLSPRSLELGLVALSQSGFDVEIRNSTQDPATDHLMIQWSVAPTATAKPAVQHFLEAIEEDYFRRRYLAQATTSALARASAPILSAMDGAS